MGWERVNFLLRNLYVFWIFDGNSVDNSFHCSRATLTQSINFLLLVLPCQLGSWVRDTAYKELRGDIARTADPRTADKRDSPYHMASYSNKI